MEVKEERKSYAEVNTLILRRTTNTYLSILNLSKKNVHMMEMTLRSFLLSRTCFQHGRKKPQQSELLYDTSANLRRRL